MTFRTCECLHPSIHLVVVAGACQPTEFYIVKLQSERYVSTCPSVRTYSGITIMACLRMACRYRGDAVHFRDSSCVIKRCGPAGPRLEQRATGWNIYVRGGQHTKSSQTTLQTNNILNKLGTMHIGLDLALFIPGVPVNLISMKCRWSSSSNKVGNNESDNTVCIRLLGSFFLGLTAISVAYLVPNF